MNTIPDIFRAQAVRAGSKIAVKIHGGTDPLTAKGLSYAQLYALFVNKSRLFDTQFALPHGATVAIVADNSLEYLVAAYSAIFAGRAVFVISTKSLPEHLRYFLQRSLTAHVFCSAAQRELCKAAMLATGTLDPERNLSDLAAFAPVDGDLQASAHALQAFEHSAPTESTTAVILHTSGTTRTPKLVYLSHRNILANQLASDGAFRNHWVADSVSLGWLPLFHGYALLAEFLRDMIAGGTWIHLPIAGAVTAEILLQAVEQSGTNVLCCVPWMLNLIHEKIGSEGADGAALRTMQKLKFIVTGGSNLGTPLGDFYRERGVRIVTMFGLSEAAGFVLHSPFDGSAWDELLPNAAQGAEFVPIAEGAREHELVITRSDLFSGKVLYPPGESDPHADKSRLETGDLFLRKGSGWTYLGRGDQVYNGAHGEKVNPLLFELGLEQFAAVQKVFAFGEEMAFNVALVKLNPGYTADAALLDALSRHIQEHVNPGLESPDRVYPGDVFLLGPDEAMPLTPKGSVNRKEAARILKQRVEARAKPAGGGVADAATVSAIFQRELASYLRPGEQGTAEATLLELGFDSLMTLSLRNNLQEKLQLQIPIALMLGYPPLKEFELALIALNTQAQHESPRHKGAQVDDAEGWRCIALEQVVFHHAYYLFPGPTFGGSFSLVAPRKLDAVDIERGLRFLERNHEVLRSVYREDGRFRIADHSMISRAFISHSEMKGSHDLNDNLPVQELIQNDFAPQPYNFTDGAAWRYATVDITNAAGETRTMLFIGINHIIGDFRTFGLIVREFMHYVDGRIGEADLVPDAYRAVLACAQPDHMQRLTHAMHTLLTAGFDEIPRGVDLRRGARLRFNFRDIDMRALADAFRASNISVFNGVYTAWVIAASRHVEGLALEDFPSVTSVTTRISKELETVMGCFVYTPVYRFHLDAAATMKANALRVQQTTLDAFKGVLINPVEYFERAMTDERNLMPIIKRNIFLYRSPDELIEPVPHWGCYRNDYFEDRCNVGAYFDFCANKADNTMEGYLTVNLLFCSPEIARRVLNEVEFLMKTVLRYPKLDFIPAQLLQQAQESALN